MEATLLQSYIRGGRLRRWLSRPDCPEVIKECKALFDKAYSHQIDDEAPDSDEEPPFKSTSRESIPKDLRALTRGADVELHARLHHRNIIYSRSSTHLGNSLIFFYPGGDKSAKPVPACIKYIFSKQGALALAVQRQRPAPVGTTDPFTRYPYFPAKLYSSKLSNTLETVQVDWIMCHFVRWQLSSDLSVVLMLPRVCAGSTCIPQILIMI